MTQLDQMALLTVGTEYCTELMQYLLVNARISYWAVFEN